MSTVCLCLSWFLSFLFVKIYPSIFDMVGLDGILYMFCGCCFAGALFITLFIPETKGKKLSEIEKYFEK